MTAPEEKLKLDIVARRRAMQFEEWDHERLAYYAAWLEQQISVMRSTVEDADEDD